MVEACSLLRRSVASILLCALPLAPAAVAGDDEHLREIEEWHAWRIERLRQPTGWMTLVGMYPLPAGKSRFGSAQDNDLVFPPQAPSHAGVFRNVEGQITLSVAEDVVVTHEDTPVTTVVLHPDTTEDTTILIMGSLQFHAIERGGKLLLRVRDLEHPVLQTFESIERFPVSKEWRKVARFERFDPPRELKIPDVLGNLNVELCPGAAVFEHCGREFRLYPTQVGDQLFFVFADATTGDETYGGGRYLYTDLPPEGVDEVVVDFNKSYNPPCVFTPFSTCTLPTAENTLDVAITAGEKVYLGYEH